MLCAFEIAAPFYTGESNQSCAETEILHFSMQSFFSSVHFYLFDTFPPRMECATSQLLIHNASTTRPSLKFFLAVLNKPAQCSCQTDMVEDTVLVSTEA